MPTTVKVKNPNTGDLIDAHVVKVVKADEPFTYITLEDGSEITMRNTVARVLRYKNTWDENGNPIYDIQGSGYVTINAPEKLKKKTSTDEN